MSLLDKCRCHRRNKNHRHSFEDTVGTDIFDCTENQVALKMKYKKAKSLTFKWIWSSRKGKAKLEVWDTIRSRRIVTRIAHTGALSARCAPATNSSRITALARIDISRIFHTLSSSQNQIRGTNTLIVHTESPIPTEKSSRSLVTWLSR